MSEQMSVDEALKALGDALKVGSRNSRADAGRIQAAHDLLCELGAQCDESVTMPEPERTEKGNALKAIGKTDTELRVANYMVLFGGRDLEGVANGRNNGDGSRGEYFSKNTQFDSSYTDVGTLYVDWEHGLAPDGEPDADDVLGFVDWKTAKIDDKGLFVERVLNRRNQYVQWLETLIDDGLIGNSSEAVSKGVAKADDGEIKTWPLRRDTLTVTPMEPRMITQNSLAALKALSTRIPALRAYIEQDKQDDGDGTEPVEMHKAQEPEAGGTPVAEGAADDGESHNCDDVAKRLTLELELLQLQL